MKKKKIIIISISIFFAILLTIIVLPFIFKDKIIETVKIEINKTINAEVNWDSFSFSLIKSFPDFKLELKKFSVKGINEFGNDTLMFVDNFGFRINLMSVFKGDEYEIKSIDIKEARINAIVLKDGRANWDIVKPSEEIPEEDAEPTKFAVALKNISIKNSYIKYRDDEMDFTLEISGLNHRLRGNLTESVTKIRTKTTAESVSMIYEGIPYLSKANFSSDFDMDANMDTWRFDFLDNNIKFNELLMNFEGWFQMNDENYDMDLKFSTPSTEFKHLLSMVPAIYAKEFDDIETKGEFAFLGHAKGIYDSLNLPEFGLQLNVKSGMFKYPDLPQSVNDIFMDAKISNKGGSADLTIIDVKNFALKMAGNPIAMKLFVSTPISDPNIDFSAKGKLDFKTINSFYPLEEGQKIDGLLNADIVFKGRYSMIEKEQYEKFVADGLLEIKDLFYSDKDMPKGLSIPYGKLAFSPKYAELTDLQIKMEDSDMSVKGRLDNILDYFFDKAPLIGRFTTNSNYFNTNPFLATDESSQTETEASESTPMEAFDIPKNIDFTLTSSFKKLIYDDIELANMRGDIIVKDQKAEMKNLRFDLFDGETVMNGFYSSAQVLPKIGFNLNLNQINFQKVWNSFEIIQKFAPIAENAKGKFSGTISLDADLNKDLSPKLETVNSKGSINTKSVSIIGSDMMAKLAKETKIAAFKQLNLANLAVQYLIKDGKLSVEPFNIKYEDMNVNVSGFSRLDQSLDYVLAIEIPRKAFGNATNDFVNSLTGKAQQKGVNINLGEKIKFDVQIIGTFTNPVFKTGLKDKATSLVDDAKEQVKEKVEEVKQEVITTVKEGASKAIAEAKRKADAIMASARTKADAARAEAKRAGDLLIQEADAQGKKLIAEAKNPIAKIAAEKSAKIINNEAQSKIDKLNKEADNKINQILKKAQDEADLIVKEAEQKTK